MYAKFFGLSQDPFSIAPDPRYLFMSDRHREALAHLLYGLRGGGGFVLLSGEVGTGKTTVCRCFLEQVPADCNVAYIFNPKLSSRELLQTICDEFHIALAPTAASPKDFIDPLNAFLLQAHAAGQSNVLIIDEAQNLSANVLEQLRLLTNLETNERKLLQVVLIGQPELRRMLARPELEQLAQRVIARFHLDALSAAETAHYIAHRLTVAGLPGASPFKPAAVKRIHKLSRGVPRRINLLCDRAMLGAYSSGQAEVSKPMVDKAALEVFGPALAARPSARDGSGGPMGGAAPRWRDRAVAGAACMAAVAGAALLSLELWKTNAGAARPALSRAATAAPAEPAPAIATPAPGTALTAPSASSALSASSAAAAAAPVPAAQTPAWATAADVSAALLPNTASANAALQLLAQAWGLQLSGPDVCAAAAKQQVWCFGSEQTTLSLIRALDRPGVVALSGSDGRRGYAVLARLTDDAATLRIANASYTVPLATLAELWRGDFSTLRRLPESALDTRNGPNPTGRPAAEWLAAQLAKAGTPLEGGAANPATGEAALRSRINSFQRAHGLRADGVAGALTLMQLNRAIGMDEPRLLVPSR